MTHELKTWPYYFAQVWAGVKLFEMRKNDRNFQIGNRLLLKEFEFWEQSYSGREILVEVLHILKDSDMFTHTLGLREGFCCMSIKVISKHDSSGPEIHTVSN